MRRRASVAAEWRKSPNTKIILIGVIPTDSPEEHTIHWTLAQLRDQLGADLVLLRAGDDIKLRQAVAALGRSLSATREPIRTEPPASFLNRWLLKDHRLIWALIGFCLITGAAWGLLLGNRRRRRALSRALQRVEEHTPDIAASCEADEITQHPPVAITVEVTSAGDEGRESPLMTKTFSPGDLDGADRCILLGSGLNAHIRLDDAALHPVHAAVHINRDGTFDLEIPPDSALQVFEETIIGPELRRYFLPTLSLRLRQFNIDLHSNAEVMHHV
jgi:hypothetical protein